MNTENRPLISVVIPIYNGEKYLPKTLESLLNQTYSNFEVILVNDLSTDNSVSVIQNHIKNDSRFRIINRDKKGGTAVKGIVYGFPYCRGEYFFYMSQDDFIDTDLFEKTVKKATETNADIVITNTIYYQEGKLLNKIGDYPLNNDYNSEILPKKAFLESLDWKITNTSLRKMSLMKTLPVVDNYYNDCECSFRKQFLYANKIVFCDTNFYYRQDNADAITKKINHFTFDVLTTDIILLELLIEHNYSRKQILKRTKQLIRGFGSWKRKFINNYDNFNKEEQNYVRETLLNARKKLYSIIKQQKYIEGYFLMFSSDLRIKIKE